MKNWIRYQLVCLSWLIVDTVDAVEWFIARLLPRWLVRLAFVRVFTHGTTGLYSETDSSDVRASTLLNRWERPNG